MIDIPQTWPVTDTIPLEEGDELVTVVPAQPAAMAFTKQGRCYALIPHSLGQLDVKLIKIRQRP